MDTTRSYCDRCSDLDESRRDVVGRIEELSKAARELRERIYFLYGHKMTAKEHWALVKQREYAGMIVDICEDARTYFNTAEAWGPEESRPRFDFTTMLAEMDALLKKL